ncbi:MAG: hypothetical protein P4L81_07870 [Candidatus Pacebacteria bacterium]|nr:hypothetical protein [Candidatus Paceibacterota bacterium]
MGWHIQEEDVELFRRELWKDERSFPKNVRISPDEFAKDCFDERRALVELRALQVLSNCSGEPLCPAARSLGGSLIALKRVRGVRLFDLLRLLKLLELHRRDGKAAGSHRILMLRARQRLATIQAALYSARDDLALIPYPMKEKLNALMMLLARVFGAEDAFAACRGEISAFAQYWDRECCVVPFRDATVKNMLVEESRMEQRLDIDDVQRIDILARILDNQPEDYWHSIPIWDIDFSSVEHLTAPEDDPISLHFHEWTEGSLNLTADGLDLIPQFAKPDAYRAAAAFMIRYLRFGGRKLSYKIINSQGFEVRFRYDDPHFYFDNIRFRCSSLSSQFVADYSNIFGLIEDIRNRAAFPAAADEVLRRVDHFRRFEARRGEFWQENPNESQREE